VLPWGVGCSIVYNYVDLVVRNDTEHAFQLRAWVGERYLHGQLRTDVRPEHSFRVEARGEQFLRRDGQVFRRNEIWRRVIDRRTGDQVGEEMVKANCALVVYEPGPGVDVIDVD
jgi:vancomycin resistance protein VanW